MKKFKTEYLISLLFISLLNQANAADGFSGYYGPAQGKSNVTPARDPFTNSNKMYNEVGIQTLQKANQANYNYQPGAMSGGVMPMVALPKMRLKGLVSKPNQKPAALLELEGSGVYYVTAGEEIGLGQSGVLKILSVSESGVKVQAPYMNQVFVVR